MSMLKRATCLAVLLSAVCGAATADAALIVRDYAVAGDGLLTYDTVSGLEWLDFSVSLGHAPGSVLSTYTDFHMASREEANSLFIDAGIAADHIKFESYAYYTEDLDAGHLLSATIGVTQSAFGGIVEQIHGRVLRADGLRYDTIFSEIRTPPAGTPGMATLFVTIGNTLNSWQSDYADFLVRVGQPEPSSSVPEIGSWAMMLAGFGLIGMAQRRRVKVRFA